MRKFLKRMLTIVTVSVMALSLGGCVVYPGGYGWGHGGWGDGGHHHGGGGRHGGGDRY
jgi:uncharacterized membrane protein YgcG